MPDYDELANKRERVLLHGISIKNFWGTPLDVFDALDQEFDFELDAAATCETAKCKIWYGLNHPLEQYRDAFSMKWIGRVFLNPPYSPDGGGLFRWAAYAAGEVMNGNAEVVVMLLPGTADTEWAQFLWESGAELRFTPRIRFVDPAGERTNPMGGSLVAVLRPNQPARSLDCEEAPGTAPILFGYAPWKQEKK